MTTTQTDVLKFQLARLQRLLRQPIPECLKTIYRSEVKRLQPQLERIEKK